MYINRQSLGAARLFDNQDDEIVEVDTEILTQGATVNNQIPDVSYKIPDTVKTVNIESAANVLTTATSDSIPIILPTIEASKDQLITEETIEETNDGNSGLLIIAALAAALML